MSPAARASCAAVSTALLAGLLAGGCVEPCPQRLVGLPDLIRDYNVNADAVPRLWARAKLSVTMAYENGTEFTWQSGAPTCLLLLAKGPGRLGPHDFALIGRETAAVELFRLGSSGQEGLYYFWYHFGNRGGAWYGRHELAGAPGIRDMPIDPMQLLSVLAVCPLPEDGTQLPAVAVSMNKQPGDYAYVVTYIDRQPVTGRILFRREVFFRWSDTAPPRPYRVNILDTAGRRVMTANLKDYRPIALADVDGPTRAPPIMPADIEIVANPFPGVAASVKRIHLVLSGMTTADKWDREQCRFWERLPGGIEPVAVDRDISSGRTTQPATRAGK